MERQRHAGTIDESERWLGEPLSELDRLQSLRLGTERSGWVPAVEPDPDPIAAPLPSQQPSGSRSQTAGAEPSSLGELAKGWAADRLPPSTHHLLDRVRPGTVVTALLAVVVVVLTGVAWHHHRAPGGYPASYDPSTASSSLPVDPTASPAPSGGVDSASIGSDAASIVVDVGGRVRKPGLVTLPQGARVADALAAAGGPLRHKEVATLDLAARVADGQLLLVGVGGSAAAGASSGGTTDSASGSTAPVSLSTATLTELETLPGVGPVTAQKIIDWRTAHNGFTSVQQLQQVSGIGPAHYASISPLVTP